jgi:N-acetylmuramoyl-L-alanine amidase
LGGIVRWDPLLETGIISAGGHQAAFETGVYAGQNALVIYDGREVLELPSPYRGEKGQLLFPEEFVAGLSRAFERSLEEEASRLRIAAIIIDPGHGGKDGGASGALNIDGKQVKVLEKDITLDVSKRLYTRLRAAYPDKQVLLTRSDDSYPTLEGRVLIANNVPLRQNEAIVFISIHANASFNKNARGFEVWYLSPDYRRDVLPEDTKVPTEVLSIYNAMLEEEYTTESIMMANTISLELVKSFGNRLPSRGIKAEEWFVVRNARMPSVLVELGFVTNELDATLMTGSADSFADALSMGIKNFIGSFEKSGGFTHPVDTR